MNGRDAADMQAAYASLFNGKPRIGGLPWPEAEPYVIVWCPHPKKGCRIGAVYATEWGYFWMHVDRHKAAKLSTSVTHTLSVGYTLLTYPDGTRRNFEVSPASFTAGSDYRAGCRHWMPTKKRGAPFIADEMFALLDDVRAGRIRRPANYVAPWNR